MRPSHHRLLGFLLLGLTACSSGGSPASARQPARATAATTSHATTTTTGASLRPTATARPRRPAPAPPPLLNTGRDYARILTSLLRYSYWIEEHPDRSLVHNVAALHSTHEFALGDELARLEAHRAHYADDYAGATVELATIRSDLVSARAHITFRRRAIVDENNTPLAMPQKRPNETTVVVMVKRRDDHWYLVSIGDA